MVENCGATCSKYFLVAFNTIFFICGCGVLGVGIWVLTDGSGFLKLTNLNTIDSVDKFNNKSSFEQVGTLLIVAGAIVFVIAFLGCCGALKEWRPLLVMYALFLIVILGLEVGAGIYAAVSSNKAQSELKKAMKASLDKLHDNGTTSAFNEAWDEMIKYFGCCGAYNFSDYDANPPIPKFCCNKTKLNAELLNKCYENPSLYTSSLYQEGCGDALIDFIKSKLNIIIGIGIGIGLIQIFGIVFAFCLCSAIGSKY